MKMMKLNNKRNILKNNKPIQTTKLAVPPARNLRFISSVQRWALLLSPCNEDRHVVFDILRESGEEDAHSVLVVIADLLLGVTVELRRHKAFLIEPCTTYSFGDILPFIPIGFLQ